VRAEELPVDGVVIGPNVVFASLILVTGDQKEIQARCNAASASEATDLPLDWTSAASRARLAGTFGGSDLVFLGEASGTGPADTLALHCLARVGKRLVYVALSAQETSGPEPATEYSVRAQMVQSRQPFASDTRAVRRGTPVVWAFALPQRGAGCLLVRSGDGVAGSSAWARSAAYGAVGSPTMTFEQPQLTWSRDPAYPPEARRERREGVVAVGTLIDERGSVRSAWAMLFPPGSADLAYSALDAVLDRRYEPGRVDGRPSLFFLVSSFRFSLD
jgi:TonB family protein